MLAGKGAAEELILIQRASAYAARATAAAPCGLPQSGYIGAMSATIAATASSLALPERFSAPTRSRTLFRNVRSRSISVASPIVPWLGTTLAGFSDINSSSVEIHVEILDGFCAARNR